MTETIYRLHTTLTTVIGSDAKRFSIYISWIQRAIAVYYLGDHLAGIVIGGVDAELEYQVSSQLSFDRPTDLVITGLRFGGQRYWDASSCGRRVEIHINV